MSLFIGRRGGLLHLWRESRGVVLAHNDWPAWNAGEMQGAAVRTAPPARSRSASAQDPRSPDTASGRAVARQRTRGATAWWPKLRTPRRASTTAVRALTVAGVTLGSGRSKSLIDRGTSGQALVRIAKYEFIIRRYIYNINIMCKYGCAHQPSAHRKHGIDL